MPVCLSHHGTRRKGCLGIGHPTLEEKGQLGTRQNTSPLTSRPHVGQLTRVGRSGSASQAPAMRKVGGPNPNTPAGVLHVQSKLGGGLGKGKQGPAISIWEAKMRYFLGRMQRRLRLLFRLPRCGFSLKRAESSFGCCTLPPTNRQGRQNSLRVNVSIRG